MFQLGHHLLTHHGTAVIILVHGQAPILILIPVLALMAAAVEIQAVAAAVVIGNFIISRIFFVNNHMIRKGLQIIIIYILTYSSSYGQCITGNCKNGNGLLRTKDEVQYEGGLKNGKFQFKLLDGIVLVGALAGLIMWHLTNDAAYNIYILTAVMLVSVVPMIIKTFKDPHSETKLPWQINLVATLFLVCTITSLQPVDWLVQMRQLVFSGLMNFALVRKKLK